MATPPEGPYRGEYGEEYSAQPPGGGRNGRFDSPSAPGGEYWRPFPGRQPEDGGAYPGQEPGGRGGSRDWQQHQPPASPGATPGAGGRPSRRGHLDGESPQPLVRPYAMTGGRTRPRYQLAIEALVSTTAAPAQMQGQLPEHQRICDLCYEVKSVAEVSALVGIPLGVARILVADLAEAGLVAIHQPGHEGEPGGQPDVTLLERVLSGLRKL